MSDTGPKDTSTGSSRSDLVLVISGLGCWVAFACSLGLGAFSLYATPTGMTDALLLVAITLAAIAALMVRRYIYNRDLYSVPLLSGFLGSAFLVTVLILVSLQFLRGSV